MATDYFADVLLPEPCGNVKTAFGSSGKELWLRGGANKTKNNARRQKAKPKRKSPLAEKRYALYIARKKDECENVAQRYMKKDADFLNGALRPPEWQTLAEQKLGLRIRDIIRLQPGTRLRVVVLDRNWGDIVFGQKKAPQLLTHFHRAKYRPEAVLKPCFATYIHGNGLTGKMQFAWNDKPDDFTFEVLRGDMWGPMMQSGDWSLYPSSSLVGWRGPMLRVDDLVHMPPLLPLACKDL